MGASQSITRCVLWPSESTIYHLLLGLRLAAILVLTFNLLLAGIQLLEVANFAKDLCMGESEQLIPSLKKMANRKMKMTIRGAKIRRRMSEYDDIPRDKIDDSREALGRTGASKWHSNLTDREF